MTARGSVRLATILLLLVVVTSPAAIEAKVFLTQDEALALAFGEASRAEMKTAFLTDEQVQRVKTLAGSEPPSRVVVYYEGEAPPGRQITAWFETHLVRTLPETVMVVVGKDARVLRVDILSFDEPEDYMPKARWLEQFEGKPLDDELSTSRAIRAVTGATLSSRAITATVRRILALHEVLHPALAPPSPEPHGHGEPRGKAGEKIPNDPDAKPGDESRKAQDREAEPNTTSGQREGGKPGGRRGGRAELDRRDGRREGGCS